MTPQAIRDAIAADPALQALAAAGDTQGIADALSVDRWRYAPLAVTAFAAWAASTGLRAAIEDHAATTASPLRSIALALIDALRGQMPITLHSTAGQQMLGAWVQAQAITQAQADDLMVLARVDDRITHEQVSEALKGG